jgi:hypothetical protein
MFSWSDAQKVLQMRTIYFAAFVILEVPIAVESQEKRPKATLLYCKALSQ